MARETVEYIIPTDLDDIPDGSTYKKMSGTEQTKLTGIEDSATTDQTGGEIKTAYEAEANAYTDTKDTKLSGIEDSATADQTAAEVQASILAQADGDIGLMAVAASTGEKKVYSVHINASGNIEADQDTQAES